jgi:hypothetical protein
MSDTPETDEAQFGTGRVSVDFARRLERERNQARQERDELKDALEIAVEYVRESLAEYDARYAIHLTAEPARQSLCDDLEKIELLLEKLKENKSGGV